MTRPRTVSERISDEYYQLTAAERKVADYVVIHQRDTQFMSISDLADACGVAEATVSRFCRRLKYKGYNAFKLAVANTAAQRPGNLVLSGEIDPEDNVPDLCQKLYGSAVDALSQTVSLIRPEDISAAARRKGNDEAYGRSIARSLKRNCTQRGRSKPCKKKMTTLLQHRFFGAVAN